ncbi:MAG: M23 family peptidase [Betaproteobacteria bacterium]|nr:M23 family peptidase [Betaproteobacteria bacterium]NBY04498.1 M23 family peptidase [Betaproteobacteria bacterium]
MNFGLKPILLSLWATWQSWHRRHPHAALAGVSAFMLLAGGGAVAVASLGPDASDLPVRQVIDKPLQALPSSDIRVDLAQLQLFRSEVSRSNDSADSLLSRLGVADASAAQFLRQDPLVKQHLLARSGRNLQASTNAQQHLSELVARWASDDGRQFKRLRITRQANGTFTSALQEAPLQASTQMASGVIQTSLFAATDEARIPDSVAHQLADIFAGDIDFYRALRKGDRFSVVYESLEADGEPLRTGKVLAAQFLNNGKTYHAVWFQEPSASKGGYFNLAGQSLRRAYLASPLAFSRVTSGFKLRFHPILQTWRAHLGVDYAAPTGTPVRSVGDGVVEAAGQQGGYGNVVTLSHRNGHKTVYAHLSRIDVRVGQSVSQGQTLGAVGATGWATGPHLHFEFRVNGKHQDPLTLARQSEAIPVSEAALPQFRQHAAQAQKDMAAAASFTPANIQ